METKQRNWLINLFNGFMIRSCSNLYFDSFVWVLSRIYNNSRSSFCIRNHISLQLKGTNFEHSVTLLNNILRHLRYEDTRVEYSASSILEFSFIRWPRRELRRTKNFSFTSGMFVSLLHYEQINLNLIIHLLTWLDAKFGQDLRLSSLSEKFVLNLVIFGNNASH